MSLEIENQLKCKVTISYVDKQWNNDIYMIENQLKGKVTISYVDEQWNDWVNSLLHIKLTSVGDL